MLARVTQFEAIIDALHESMGGREIRSMHTATIVTKVVDLITPLCQYPQGVLDKGDHNKKAADGWKVSAVSP